MEFGDENIMLFIQRKSCLTERSRGINSCISSEIVSSSMIANGASRNGSGYNNIRNGFVLGPPYHRLSLQRPDMQGETNINGMTYAARTTRHIGVCHDMNGQLTLFIWFRQMPCRQQSDKKD